MKKLRNQITIRFIRIWRYLKMINKSANLSNEVMLKNQAKIYLVDNFKSVLVDFYNDVIDQHLDSKSYSMNDFRAIENIRKAINDYRPFKK